MFIKLRNSITCVCLILSPITGMTIESLDRIATVVNEDVITTNELESRTRDFAIQLNVSTSESEKYNSLKKQVLEKMISNRVQLQLASQLGISIDDIALNRMLEKLAASNDVTLTELISKLKQEGLDYSRFREQTRDELIIKQLQQRVIASKINISDQEIDQFMKKHLAKNAESNEYHIHHILIATPENAKPEDIQKALSKAEMIYEQIKSGADFNEVAIRESSGRMALKGGDLGVRKGDELPEIFVNAIKNIQKNDITKPIQSAGGFHILKLVGSTSHLQIVQQTHARHILIRSGANMTDENAQQQLSQLRERIINGDDFAQLANENSQDPGSKDNGGDLGWANSSKYVEEFKQVMNTLNKNQISEPFRTQFGWHIIQVLDRRDQDATSSSLKTQARQSIQKRKIDEAISLWLRKIRDEAYVEYFDKSLVQSE